MVEEKWGQYVKLTRHMRELGAVIFKLTRHVGKRWGQYYLN